MYYKIVSGGEIVDVCDSLTFVRWQSKNGMFLNCKSASAAAGIVSSDGSTIYLLDGAEQVSGLEYAAYSEISAEEYESLREQLIENGVLSDQETGAAEESSADDTTGTTETVKKSTLLVQVEALQAQVELLTECLLEISGLIY